MSENNALAVIAQNGGLAALRELPVSERAAALKAITSYIGAESNKADKYIGKEIEVIGCVIHQATVRPTDQAPKKVAVTEDGEIIEEETELVKAKRTVFKLKNGETIGFVAMAAAQFAEEFLIPLFGVGDWMEDGKPVALKMVISQISTKKGRSYAFQVL